MREFEDGNGTLWVASIGFESGTDYKGRYFFEMVPSGGGESDRVSLADVRWNSEKTAQRTLATMSDVELRRRLRSARGRSLSSEPTVHPA